MEDLRIDSQDFRDAASLTDEQISHELTIVESLSDAQVRQVYNFPYGHMWFQYNEGRNPIYGLINARYELIQSGSAV